MTDAAQEILALQHFLMDAARRYPKFIAPALATAARLDYALMLATETAGVPVDAVGAARAIDDALAAAFDDAVRFLVRLTDADRRDARRFCSEHGGAAGILATLSEIERREGVHDGERSFALIALRHDLGP